MPCLATIKAFKTVFHPRCSNHSNSVIVFHLEASCSSRSSNPQSLMNTLVCSPGLGVLRPRQLAHTQVLLFFCLIQAGPGQVVGRIWLNKRLCLCARLAPQDPGAARTSSSPLVPRSQIHSLGAVYSVKQGAGRPPALIIEACPA